ncbi:FecCD family ABC transporter permease [Staphylococcus simulans]
MTNQSSHSLVEKKQRRRTTLLFIGSVCFLFLIIYFNLTVGSTHMKFKDVADYLLWHHDTKNTFIIHNIRMPRMVGGLLIGAALAVAGLFMQAMTRNPLASPQIFGVNAGASFVIVVIIVIFPALTAISTLLAFIGALIGGSIVYMLSDSTRGMTPVKLALAGMTVHLFFTSLTQGIILLNEDSTTTVYFWLVGTLSTLKWPDVLSIMPWIIGAFIGAMFMARQISVLELGDELARGLGQNIKLTRMLLGVLVVILAGASVSIAGPIGFIGLIVPHIVKYYTSHNYFVIIPLTMIFGAALLLLSDVLSRLISFPFETPVGIVTSFVGAIYFLALTLRGVKRT